jgi:large subunit ribosomal protein L10
MSRKVKGLIEKELETQFKGVNECVVVSLRGIGGTENNLLRGDLKKKNIRVTMVKNSLARRAFSDLGMPAMSDVLAGPSAIAYGGDSIVDLVKAVLTWGKKIEHLQIKGGFLEGQSLDADATKALAKLPNRAQLQGAVVMLAQSPGRRVAGCIAAPAGRIAGCIEALVKKLELAAPPAAVAVTETPAAETPTAPAAPAAS